jgi:uncharacterized membrane protein YczE
MNKKISSYLYRLIKLNFGLALYALGIYFCVSANIGLAPWDALNQGVTNLSGLSFGTVIILIGVVILVADIFLKEKLGVGSILNMLLIGYFYDLIAYLFPIPQLNNFILGVAIMLLGQFTICIASYFYIGAEMGCGPRDALMVALHKRFPKLGIGGVRGIIEGSVLLVGWLLGAKVGLGTAMNVFGISIMLQLTFKFLNFEVSEIKHESILDTIKNLRNIKVIGGKKAKL